MVDNFSWISDASKVAQNKFTWLQNKLMNPQQNGGDISTDTLRNRQIGRVLAILELFT
jgi:hypothetical protein